MDYVSISSTGRGKFGNLVVGMILGLQSCIS